MLRGVGWVGRVLRGPTPDLSCRGKLCRVGFDMSARLELDLVCFLGEVRGRFFWPAGVLRSGSVSTRRSPASRSLDLGTGLVNSFVFIGLVN